MISEANGQAHYSVVGESGRSFTCQVVTPSRSAA